MSKKIDYVCAVKINMKNMKKLILFSIYSFFAISLFSQQVITIEKGGKGDIQQDQLDVASIRCHYKFTQPLTVDSEARQVTDTMTLDIGSKASVYYDVLRHKRDSIYGDFMANGLNPSGITSVTVMKEAEDWSVLDDKGGTTIQSGSKGETARLYKNRQTSEITIIDRIENDAQKYKCVEKIVPQQWDITTDTLTVLGYLCQKATTSFRGRSYEAWFAPDIPVNDGPWKFYGLPGLILKVTDTDNLFTFEMIGLEQLNPSANISMAKEDYMKCSRKDLEKLKKKQSGGMAVNVNGGNILIVSKKNKNEYEQLEKE